MPISNPSVNSAPPIVNVTAPNVKSANVIASRPTIPTDEVIRIAQINPNRLGLTIFNKSTKNTVCIDVLESVDDGDFMFSLAPGAFYEMPSQGIYTKPLYAISSNADYPDGTVNDGEGVDIEVREFFI